MYSRWGRTGSGGQSKLEGPFDTKKEALTAFGKIYKNKTKNTWSQRDVGGDAGESALPSPPLRQSPAPLSLSSLCVVSQPFTPLGEQ